MSMKFRLVILGVFALAATSALAAVNASAFTPLNSHFTSNVDHVVVRGVETFPGDHNLSFQRTVNGVAEGEPIKCTHVAYHGTLNGAAATTTQSVSLRPEYKECSTGGAGPHDVTVHVPAGCGTEVFQFTSGNPGTVHDRCEITVTHPNCTIRIPPQTLSGVTYKQITEGGVHVITAEVDVQNITGHFEGGLCVFLGTKQVFHMKGSVTVKGEANGEPVGVTHT